MMRRKHDGSQRRGASSQGVAIFLVIVTISLVMSFLCAMVFWAREDATKKAVSAELRSPSTVQRIGVSRQSGPVVIQPPRVGREHGICEMEFNRVNQDRVQGLSAESLERSRAWIGNKERLSKFARNLMKGKSVDVVVMGGSITLAHGVHEAEKYRYSSQLEMWLNKYYAVETPHRVINLGVHGADMCALSKRINPVLEDLNNGGVHPSLFILEFGVNDYQGQDHLKHLDHKTDVFFDGFEELAMCAETVIYKLLRFEPQVAVMFLEFRTGIFERKTAQLLHMGVAQHYEVPVVSYTEAMFPEYFRLISLLNAADSFSVAKNETLLPYPYGCFSCQLDHMYVPFREHGCKSVCVIMFRNGVPCDEKKTPEGRKPCFLPMFAHDLVHPSRTGHQIAKDLIANAISSAGRDVCKGVPMQTHVLPTLGWLGSPKMLAAHGDFLVVYDAMQMYSRWDRLQPTKHSIGWSYYSDVGGVNFKPGWITTNSTGSEVIEFEIDLPRYRCYVIYVAVMRSYVGMGTFTIIVHDMQTKKTTKMDADGLWGARISVWSDIQVTKDDDPACTGKCSVRIKSHPQVPGREGNKVKVLTLSARKCIDS